MHFFIVNLLDGKAFRTDDFEVVQRVLDSDNFDEWLIIDVENNETFEYGKKFPIPQI
jgi:hypothetical protein